MSVQETLITYITTQLLHTQGDIQLSPDDNLLLSGLLDSYNVIRLAKFIEETYAIEIDANDITLKNFKTVNAISAYIDRQTAVARATD